MSSEGGLLRLAFCASGICFCYLFYGLLFEKLFTDKERLGATFILVTQCITNTIVAQIWQFSPSSSPLNTKLNSSPQKQLPLHHGLLIVASACYVGAMTSSNEAVQYVSYPVAVLAKSCKLIPTMLVGQCVEGRLYSVVEWMAALLISCGIVLFHFNRMQHEDGNDNDNLDPTRMKYGMILLLTSLSLDGVLSSCQNFLKRPRGAFRIPDAIETMLWMNLYATLFLIPATIYSGQFNHGMRLMQEKPQEILTKLGVLNATVAGGQIFIFLTIHWYSPTTTTTITTTRKFFTILLSVWTYGHAFTVTQWIAVGLVFSGLYLTILMVQKGHSTVKAKTE
jgi:UDP-galactose transporter B1